MSNRMVVVVSVAFVVGCSSQSAAPSAAPVAAPAAEAPQPLPDDPMNVVNIAANSKDHSTLVAAIRAADYLYAVSNPGPLTVFAPVNSAFEALPPGTVEGLVKPERQDDLRNILKYHVTTSVYDVKDLRDGQELSMANGKRTKIGISDGKLSINGAKVIASVRGTNGIVHVIDQVLLPPAR